MRKLVAIIILLISAISAFSQVSYTKVMRVANATTTFTESLSEGNILIDLNADKTYLILKAIAGTNSISALTAGVDYKEIANANPTATDSTFVWVQADTVFVGDNIAAVDSAHGVKINENLTIEADGTIRMDNEATVWDDIMVPGFSAAKNDNPPTFGTFLGGILINYFTNATNASNENQVYFTIQFPHSWKGTAIFPHIHWSPRSDPGGDMTVRWGLEYTWAEYNPTAPNTFPGPTTIYVDAPISAGSENKHLIASFGEITPSANQDGISSMMVCRLFRNSSNDTYTGDAGFLQFDIHYEKDTDGSREEFIK